MAGSGTFIDTKVLDAEMPRLTSVSRCGSLTQITRCASRALIRSSRQSSVQRADASENFVANVSGTES